MARVREIRLRPYRRVAVISDIHGELSYLKGLLQKLALRSEDALVFLGDMIEKGPQSLETLRYIMALRERYNVFPLMGNCDGWHAAFDVPGEEGLRGVLHYMLHPKPGRSPGIVWEMCREAGLEVSEDMDLGELRKYLSPEQLLGSLAHTAGLLERYEPISAPELATAFSWEKLKKEDIYLNAEELIR